MRPTGQLWFLSKNLLCDTEWLTRKIAQKELLLKANLNEIMNTTQQKKNKGIIGLSNYLGMEISKEYLYMLGEANHMKKC